MHVNEFGISTTILNEISQDLKKLGHNIEFLLFSIVVHHCAGIKTTITISGSFLVLRMNAWYAHAKDRAACDASRWQSKFLQDLANPNFMNDLDTHLKLVTDYYDKKSTF